MWFQKLLKQPTTAQLYLELLVFFILFPVLFLFDFLPSLLKLIPLILFASYCFVILKYNKLIKTNKFYVIETIKHNWISLILFPIVLYLILYLFLPDYLFADFTNVKLVIAIVCYPLFSVLPQEFIYRKFFYFRYSILMNKNLLYLLNAILFSFAHIYFQNWLAIIITFKGSLVFSIMYKNTNSITLPILAHSLYGLAILCSGLSGFFNKEF